MSIVFLTLDEVIEIHRVSIERFGGTPELRDPGLLEAALAAPQSAFGGQYLHPSRSDMAAAYLFHLAANHPFVDGNKRTAAIAARVFLTINGVAFAPTEMEYGDLVIAIAAGRLDKSAAVAFFKKHARPA